MHKIQLTFNTQNVDISIALKALDSYRSGNYEQAIAALLEVLDVEPKNWEARLMLGACYYRLGQYFAAQCAFRLICEQATDSNVRTRAREGLLASGGKMGRRVEIPPEFGSCAVRQELAVGWLE
jgi:tetratricopeptide (TPR) repeat protein